MLYGPQPGLAKQAFLIDEYKSLKADANRSEAEEQYLRQQFLDKLKEEEENFQTLRDCLRVERGQLLEMERDSQLMLSEKAAKIAAAEENRLRNYLQQLFKQFTAWRQQPVQDGPVPVPPPDGVSEQPIGGGPPPAGPSEGSTPEPVGGSSVDPKLLGHVLDGQLLGPPEPSPWNPMAPTNPLHHLRRERFSFGRGLSFAIEPIRDLRIGQAVPQLSNSLHQPAGYRTRSAMLAGRGTERSLQAPPCQRM